MSTLVLPMKPAVRSSTAMRERLPAGLLALAGGVLAIVGATAPWLSFFAGLQPISGLDGMNGQGAALLGGVTVTTGVLFLATGRAALRWVMGLLGFALLAVAGWSGINLLSTLSELQADPLLVAEVGPGLPVVATGGALAFATLFLPSRASRSTASVSEPALRSVVAATLAMAGVVHLAVGPEHLADSVLIGGAMIAAGGVQLGLAVLVGRGRTAAWPLVLAIALNVALAVGYVAAVTVGLPVEAVPHVEDAAAAGHGAIGHTEAVTPLGLAVVGLELIGAAIAFGIVRMGRSARRSRPGVDGFASRPG